MADTKNLHMFNESTSIICDVQFGTICFTIFFHGMVNFISMAVL